MSKISTVIVFAAVLSVSLFCGCRSDRYYQARAAERAREYLLENAPELTAQQVSFVKYNDPVLLTGDGLEGRATGLQQVCITWEIPGADRLYMVFGVARERMDNWYPNRLIKRNFVKASAEISSAVDTCRSSAVTSLRDVIEPEDLNIIRFSNPEIAITAFEPRPEESINDPNDLSLNKFDEENVKEKAQAERLAKEKELEDAANGIVRKEPVQISLLWKISGHRYAVFCGTAADESLKSWKLNFSGIIGDYETNMACKKFLKMSKDYDTPIPVPEEEKKELPAGQKAAPEEEKKELPAGQKAAPEEEKTPEAKKEQ